VALALTVPRGEYRSKASDLGARALPVQSSADTLIIIYLYPAKSLILCGKGALANLLEARMTFKHGSTTTQNCGLRGAESGTRMSQSGRLLQDSLSAAFDPTATTRADHRTTAWISIRVMASGLDRALLVMVGAEAGNAPLRQG
jgi:hypothetical protein